MMRCPSCGDEFEPGVEVCPDCDILLAAVHLQAAPVLVPVGRFHPAAAGAVVSLARQRGLVTEVRASPDADEVLGEEVARDGLRAELAVSWGAVLATLAEADRDAVYAGSDRLPGWRDAPQGAWVDRHGRLQVARSPEEEAAEDDDRYLGPTLLALAGLLGLFAWYVGDGEWRLIAAVGAVGLAVVGLFVPR